MCCKGREEQDSRRPFSHSLLAYGDRTQRGRSEGSNLDPLRQVAGNVACMVRDAQVIDAVVSGLSTLHYFVFRGTPNITEPKHRHKRSCALKLCTFFFLSLGR